MEKQTKILLGVGAVIAAYLILKPKKAVSQNNSNVNTTPSPLVNKILNELNNPQNLTYRYKVVKDINFGSGSFSDNTSFNSLAPKVGDIIEAKGAIELPKYKAGGGTVYPYTICISQINHNISKGKECVDLFIPYDTLQNLGQVIYK